MVQTEEDENVLKGVGGKWILFCWEHESVILLLVTDSLFWLMCVGFHVLMTIILLQFLFSGIWPKPTSSSSDLQGRGTLLSSTWSTCGWWGLL